MSGRALLLPIAPRPRATLRLLCCPYAGAGPGAFAEWPDLLPDAIEPVALQLPGRGWRLGEPPLRRLEPLLDELVPALTSDARPFALFGHSMGALVAFELARRLRAVRAPAPRHLFVSGLRAPQLPSRGRRLHDLPEPELVEEVRALNATPAHVLEQPRLRSLVLRCLRADLELCEVYRYPPGPPLDCPITALGGTADDLARPDEVAAWTEQTTSTFAVRILPGDHFFVEERRQEVVDEVASFLMPAEAPPSAR